MEINEIANLIKSKKQEHKQAQREYSKLFTDGVITSHTYYSEPEKYHFTAEPIMTKINSTRNDIQSLKMNFRIQHIYNSMCRGKKISEIESKVSNDEIKTLDRINVYNIVKSRLQDVEKEWLE